MAISIDLTTFSGCPTLEEGKTYKISCQAMATGYQNSDMSATVNYTVPETTRTLERGTYKWIDAPANIIDSEVDFSFKSNNEDYTMIRSRALAEGAYISYTDNENSVIGYYTSHGWGSHSLNNGVWSAVALDDAYKTIVFEEDIEVPSSWYEWAITSGNLTKYEPETWILNETLETEELPFIVISFESNGTSFNRLKRGYSEGQGVDILTYYDSSEMGTNVYNGSWTNDAYRIITFSQPVTDETLLAWLEANGTKQ